MPFASSVARFPAVAGTFLSALSLHPLTSTLLPAIFTWPAESPVASEMECLWSPLENVLAEPADEVVATATVVVANAPVVIAPDVPVTTGRFAVVPIFPSLVIFP